MFDFTIQKKQLKRTVQRARERSTITATFLKYHPLTQGGLQLDSSDVAVDNEAIG